MKILVLSWEFPPTIIGGIARHVSELYPELVKLGYEIHLITPNYNRTPTYEKVEGIHVHRISVHSGNDFFHWIENMNQAMVNHGGKLIGKECLFGLIHAHDWLVGDAAIALKHSFKLPLVATIHATEWGRNNGIHNNTQHYISSKEKILAYHAWRIIVCTYYMQSEVKSVLRASRNKIDVIYNGIRPERKQQDGNFQAQEFRRQFATDEEKIVYYVGRITYEKGVSVLLNAAPQVIRSMENNVKFVIIGRGNADHFKQIAGNLGIWHKCYFTGFMSDDNLDKFQTIADCSVFPSLYEPFGIVALESFAARVPVIVSDTGGLPEVVQHTKTGIVTQANSPDSLADGILEVLKNPGYGQWLIDNAYKQLKERFDWYKLAKKTDRVYQQILEDSTLG